jgi:outer membrane receptor protein involved in Fe transport
MFGGDEYETQVDVHEPRTLVGGYVQDEVHVFPWLIVNGGARLDRDPGFGTHLTPRLAVVVLPRAPNTYELFYYPVGTELGYVLVPEQVRSTEAVWEEYLSSRVRFGLTAFTFRADRLIEQRSLGLDDIDDIYFANTAALTRRSATRSPGCATP